MKIAEGRIFKRCGCKNSTGRMLGAACPRLKRRNGSWNPAHGSWSLQLELPPTASGGRRYARRSGFSDYEAARRELDHIKQLLGLAQEDNDVLIQIADVIQKTLKARTPLPNLEELRRRINGGADITTETPTVEEWLKEWLDNADIAESTRHSYLGHITNYFLPYLGPIRLDKLKVGHIQACFDAIEERNAHIRTCRASADPQVQQSVRGMRVVSTSTKQRIRATLRSALNAALRRPDFPLHFNPAAHIKLPTARRPRPMVWTSERTKRWERTGEIPSPVMVWTPEQTRVFLERARLDRLYPLFHLIAFKGLRRGEAVGLPWSETRLSEHAIDIRTQIVQLGGKTVVSTPKSTAGERTITLDETTANELKAWRKRQAAEQLRAGSIWQDTGLVFTREDGSTLQPDGVSDLFVRIAAEAGLPPVRLHDLRHGAASLSLAAGVDVKIVSAELGHATTGFTQDTYQSVFPNVARAAAEATAALLRNQESG